MVRRPRLVAAGALAVASLAGAGVAAASHKSQTTQQATSTFAAAAVTQSRSSTCTSTDGVYQDTTATYSGTSASSDPRLSGTVTIRVRSILNTTTQLGWLSGSLAVRNSSGSEHDRRHRRGARGRPGHRLPARERPPRRVEADGELLRSLHTRRRLLVRPARRGRRDQRRRVLHVGLVLDREALLGHRRVPPRVWTRTRSCPGSSACARARPAT